ncbi:MAG TPA: hypothetical protein VL404_04320 [Candidatus Eisenbacteria bacterium]|nr:hypothetical protein [Candidatus Eisenbacteria bacterium]
MIASLVCFALSAPAAVRADGGPSTVEEEERQRLARLLSKIDLPAVESYGAAPQSTISLKTPPLGAGLPARQNEVEEETKK